MLPESALVQIILFGDQTAKFHPELRRLLQENKHGVATLFFGRCLQALRQEIGKLPSSERQYFLTFSNLVDLVEKSAKHGPNPALDTALLCVYQLAYFIRHFADMGNPFPCSPDTQLIGLCVGLLSAATVSVSRSIGELLSTAVETVILALRLGIRVNRSRHLIDMEQPTSEKWSVFVPGIEENRAAILIQEYISQEKIATFSVPYISTVSPNGITISGPPVVLDGLINSKLLSDHSLARLPLYAPYHAPHLYNERDVEITLGESFRDTDLKPQLPVYSTSTGNWIKARDTNALFEAVLEDIFFHQIRCDKLIESCVSHLGSVHCRSCTLLPIASNSSQSMCTALETAGIDHITIQSTTDKPTVSLSSEMHGSTPTQNSKIAVIGMSSRFPDADSNEQFWDILYKGLDVHRTVPSDRWNVKTHVDISGKGRNTSRIPHDCWSKEPGLFDAGFFSMSPREALQTDSAQRLSLLTAGPNPPSCFELSSDREPRGSITTTDIVSTTLGIVASEIGIPKSELTDSLNFADHGVDSLLSLTITGRLREELDLDLDASVFTDYPTVKAFEGFLTRLTGQERGASPSSNADSGVFIINGQAQSAATSSDNLSPLDSYKSNDSPSTVCVSEDPRMQIDTVISELNLGTQLSPPSLRPQPTSIASSGSSTRLQHQKHPPSTSVLLQGSPKTATKTLFLLPDGSGSAAAYSFLPHIAPDLCVYALNCPYLNSLKSLKCSLDELTPVYLAEIRRRQPKGPYSLGGWSAGGMIAYDVARLLITEEDEQVDRLILIDSPLPTNDKTMSSEEVQFLGSFGLGGDGRRYFPSSPLVLHFSAMVAAVVSWTVMPLPYTTETKAMNMLRTYLIWASDGTCDNPGDPCLPRHWDEAMLSRDIRWMVKNRVDFGPNGWEALVGAKSIAHIGVVRGATHFSIVKGDGAKKLVGFLANAMAG